MQSKNAASVSEALALLSWNIVLRNVMCPGSTMLLKNFYIIYSFIFSERSCPSVFGSDTESVEEIQFDYSKLCDSDKSHYIINFPHKFGFRTSVSNGWLRGLQGTYIYTSENTQLPLVFACYIIYLKP